MRMLKQTIMAQRQRDKEKAQKTAWIAVVWVLSVFITAHLLVFVVRI